MSFADLIYGADVIPCEQGSPDWLAARCGAITASMFSEVRIRPASGKNKAVGFTDKALKYAFRLACERLSGVLMPGGEFENWAMRRGHELEPKAREEHQIRAGVIVETCGFVLTSDGKFGASADGIIRAELAGAEYKCLVDAERIGAVLLDEDVTEFMDQMQGGMWITGLKRWHYGLYCPDLEPIGGPLWWRVIERDDDYINALVDDLMRFDRLVESYVERLRLVRWSPDETTPPWRPAQRQPAPIAIAAPAARLEIPEALF